MNNGLISSLQKEEAEALTVARHASGTASQRVEKASGTASQRADEIMDELRALGHYPQGAAGYEYRLHKRISRATEAGDFSTAQSAEIEALKIQQKDLADEIME